MNVISLFGITFIVAFFVETLIEFIFGKLFDHIAALKPYKWMQMYLAIAAAIGLAFFYRLDLLYFIGVYLKVDWQPFADTSVVGLIISGIAIGKGSNYLHDIIRFLIGLKHRLPQPEDSV
jgi:hypothetical protein